MDETMERVRVLMVEDNQDHLDLCREYLSDDMFFLDAALDGREALDKVKNNQYDIIVLDYRLPDTTGSELLRRIRAMNKETPIIFVTAMDDPDISFQVMQDGASDYIPKSFQYYERLRDRILDNLGIEVVEEDIPPKRPA
jgi:two-component system response regulator HydG